jgi:Pyridoxamine 5'-phosphate oxidase
MGKVYDAVDERLEAWIRDQSLFFVATAPNDGGHINISPKGPIETLRVLDEHTVAYLDLVGSGAETIAHLRENGRIVVMLCAFDSSPRILRLHGTGKVLPADAIAFPSVDLLPQQQRSVIRIEVHRIADSCGFGVPLMSFVGERPNSRTWAEGKLAKNGARAIEEYKAEKNARSIDGLPALG